MRGYFLVWRAVAACCLRRPVAGAVLHEEGTQRDEQEAGPNLRRYMLLLPNGQGTDSPPRIVLSFLRGK